MSDKVRGRIAANSNDTVARQIAQRKAVADALGRTKKIFVCRSEHGPHGRRARVLIDGKYFDVNQRKLDRLREGWTPEELSLEEVGMDE